MYTCVFRLLPILFYCSYLFFVFLELPLFKLYTLKIYNNNRYTCNQIVINHQKICHPFLPISRHCFKNAHTFSSGMLYIHGITITIGMTRTFLTALHSIPPKTNEKYHKNVLHPCFSLFPLLNNAFVIFELL